MRFKSITASGVEVQGRVDRQEASSGLSTIEYSFNYMGQTYEKVHRLPSLFCPSSLESVTSTVILDKNKPGRAFLRDLYCASPTSSVG